MAKLAELYWNEIRKEWLTKALIVFPRALFEQIKTDIQTNDYTSGEAILKHMGDYKPEFFIDQIKATHPKIAVDELEELYFGYNGIQWLAQYAYAATAHGIDAAWELLGQKSDDTVYV